MSTDGPISLRGSGRVELAAYGLADAEHRVEKELRAAWPDSIVEIQDVSRTGTGRIVEEFAVSYRVRGVIAAERRGDETALAAALRTLRQRLAGSRFERMSIEPSPTSATPDPFHPVGGQGDH